MFKHIFILNKHFLYLQRTDFTHFTILIIISPNLFYYYQDVKNLDQDEQGGVLYALLHILLTLNRSYHIFHN